MVKKLVLLSIVIFLLSISIAHAKLTCRYVESGNCNSNELLLLKLSDGPLDDLHSATYSYTGYSRKICCGTDTGESLTRECNQKSDTIVKLSATSNAHAQQANINTYSNDLCLAGSFNKIDCAYELTDCSKYDTEVLELSAQTDAHVAPPNKNVLPLKVCCGSLRPVEGSILTVKNLYDVVAGQKGSNYVWYTCGGTGGERLSSGQQITIQGHEYLCASNSIYECSSDPSQSVSLNPSKTRSNTLSISPYYCCNANNWETDLDIVSCSDSCTASGKTWLAQGSTKNCCEDDSNEKLKSRRISTDSSGKLNPSFNADSNDRGCCLNQKDCVFNTQCYTSYASDNSKGKYNLPDKEPNLLCTNDGQWYDCDHDQTVCETQCKYSNRWIKSGENIAFGEYGSKGETLCCGDDSGEEKVDSTSYNPTMTDTIACCDNANDCVWKDECHTSAANGGKETICNDGIDNDCDSKKDCEDPDCKSTTGPEGVYCCQTVSDCSGGGFTEGSCGNLSCTNNMCNVDKTPEKCTASTLFGECGRGNPNNGCTESVSGGYECNWVSDKTRCSCDDVCGGLPQFNCIAQDVGACELVYSACMARVQDTDPNTLPADAGECGHNPQTNTCTDAHSTYNTCPTGDQGAYSLDSIGDEICTNA